MIERFARVWWVLLLPVLSQAQTFTISTVAGDGNGTFGGDNGPATSAALNFPRGVAADAVGNFYIGDSTNCVVRKVSSAGVITTLAGVAGNCSYNGDNIPANTAELNTPARLAVDAAGNVYIADWGNSIIRKVAAGGTISTVAGVPGEAGYNGDGILAKNAELANPYGVAVDAAGNLYIADDGNCLVRKVDASGMISTIAGNVNTLSVEFGFGAGCLSGSSANNIPATNASLDAPLDVTLDAAGNLYIVDQGNEVIYKVANGAITVVAGTLNSFGFSGDNGPATKALLDSPAGIAADAEGNLYIGDSGNQRVREVLANGNIVSVAGDGASGYSKDNVPALTSELYAPKQVASGPGGYVYVADAGNNRVRLLTPQPAINSVDVSGGTTNIAQNAWVEIYGSGLAPATLGAAGMTWSAAPSFASGQMPTTLDGVSVSIDGKPAYIYYVSPAQVNVLTPLDSTAGPVQVTLTNGGESSLPFTANLQVAAPGFLRFAGTYAAALHSDYSLLGPSSLSVPGYSYTPAKPGETILLFGDGFGLPVSSLTPGLETQTGSLPSLPEVTIGGTKATVQFAGLISPGLYQINVVVPSTVASGDNQVIATYEGASSPTGAMISVSQ